MKITKRQLRRIIKEERAKLIKESITDMMDIESKVADSATGLSDAFGSMMRQMAIDEPNMIAAPDSWEEEVQNAQVNLDSALIAAIERVIHEHEEDLHNGEYARNENY